jgi:predicted acyltransferase
LAPDSSYTKPFIFAFLGFDLLFISLALCAGIWQGLLGVVFPLFLFMAGVSFPFSCAKSRERGMGDGRIALKSLKRGLILVFLGLCCGGLLKLDFASLRVWSVLGRIGVAWMIASWIYLCCGVKTRIAIVVATLALVTVGTILITAPGAIAPVDPFSAEGNFGCWLDRTVTAGHTLGKLYDPEGFAGLVPAVATAMLGMFAGEILSVSRWSGRRKTGLLLCLSAVCAVLAAVFAQFCPLNKALWSPSFVLACGTYSFFALAVFYLIVDVLGFRKLAFPLQVIGMNSITIYLAQRILGFNKATDFFFGGLASKFPEGWNMVVWQAGYVIVCWTFLYFLYRKRIFLKV